MKSLAIKNGFFVFTLKPFQSSVSSPLHHPTITAGINVNGTKYKRAGCAVFIIYNPTYVICKPIAYAVRKIDIAWNKIQRFLKRENFFSIMQD